MTESSVGSSLAIQEKASHFRHFISTRHQSSSSGGSSNNSALHLQLSDEIVFVVVPMGG
jgi:hypothetical protein